ncbi:hypothetical protein Esi_0023_0177 [Ectocarpus siliculosus]|uniref:Uncharacterized protein n=1 Tax=Ectocarpus siliculosus TaxID=2880 RepID=D8LJ12_ECTSI|nr:hypothetical protein Esi_0023_0177 [Ectocarpus siliculosus]|eukprot:CBN76896.1 hypothetical protein Esi_0023_0177 [Ectocarpus siliculosus]
MFVFFRALNFRQAYDYKRRIDLIEASMDRLPRGLRAKLRSSATGMKSPEWDRHDRLVAQLSADQDAAAAAAAAAAQASSLPGMASRGRSQSRGSRSASANANDESSRSRSRSFNLPLRGWGKGGGGGGGGVHVPDAYRIERADTDTYRNSRVDTDIEEESIRAISEGSRHQSSGGTPSRGGAEGEEEEEVGERPGRNKSFFVGLGRWGPGRRRSASTQELSSPVAGGGGGGVEKRRRNSSSAAAAAATAANTRRNSLFSSFTGERPSVAPSVDPSPDNNNQGAARRFGKKSPGAGKRKGLLKSQTMVDVPATGLRSPPPPEPLRSAKGSGGKKAWGRTSRATTAATVDVEDDLEPRQQRAKSTSGGGRPPTTTRDKRASPDARSGPGRTRWGRGRQSSSRTLGTGLSSKSTPDPVVQGRTGRLRRQTASPTPVEGLGTSSSSKSSSRSEKAKKSTTGRDREHPAREDAASAERVATLLKAEEDAEARRQLEHRIITLEMKLLVKDLVDTACVRAAERTSERSSERSSTRSNQSSLKWTPLSVSSSVAPAPLPRLSATAVQAERQSFFGNFWNAGGGKDGGDISNGDGGLGGGQGIGGGQTGGGIAGHWGGFDRDGARQQRNRSAAAAVSSNGIDIDSKAVWKPDGTRYLASARNQGRRGDDEWNEDGGEKKKKEEVEVDEEEEGFFQALRRKLFEGDKTSYRTTSRAASGGWRRVLRLSEVKTANAAVSLDHLADAGEADGSAGRCRRRWRYRR